MPFFIELLKANYVRNGLFAALLNFARVIKNLYIVFSAFSEGCFIKAYNPAFLIFRRAFEPFRFFRIIRPFN